MRVNRSDELGVVHIPNCKSVFIEMVGHCLQLHVELTEKELTGLIPLIQLLGGLNTIASSRPPSAVE